MAVKKAARNIFEELGFEADEANDLKYRAHLLLHIKTIAEKQKYSRRDLEKILDIPQPRISELMTGKIDRFSADKLFSYIEKLGYEVQMKLRRA